VPGASGGGESAAAPAPFSQHGRFQNCARRPCGAPDDRRQRPASFEAGESGDLSLKILIVLSMGLALWLTDGLMRGDVIIVAANAISLCLVGTLLGFKWREHRRP